MKNIKSLLLITALAVSISTSRAQTNVFTVGIVGYVNRVIEGSGTYNLLANPLEGPNSQLGNMFPTAGNSDQILTWNVASNDFSVIQPVFAGGSWNTNIALPLGQGFFYVNANGTFTNTFTGSVRISSFTNVLTGGSYNCIGSSVPMDGSFSNAIAGLSPGTSDQIMTWNVVSNDFSVIQPYYNGSVWNTNVNINAGDGFFYIVAATNNNNWVRAFNP